VCQPFLKPANDRTVHGERGALKNPEERRRRGSDVVLDEQPPQHHFGTTLAEAKSGKLRENALL